MRNWRRLISSRSIQTALVVAALAISYERAGAMTIDIFTATQGPASDSSNGGGGVSDSMAGPQSGNIVPAGGQREIFAEKTSSAAGNARLEIRLFDFFDGLFYTSSAGVSGRFDVRYIDLDGVDLTFGDGLTITGNIDDAAAAGTMLGLYIEDMAANFGRSEVMLTSAGEFTHTFDKADFIGVDFSQVEMVRLGSFDAAAGDYVDVPPGGDVTLTAFEVTAVPEPATRWLPALLAAGLMFILCSLRPNRRPTI